MSRSASKEEALPVALHVPAERKDQDGDSLAAVDKRILKLQVAELASNVFGKDNERNIQVDTIGIYDTLTSIFVMFLDERSLMIRKGSLALHFAPQ